VLYGSYRLSDYRSVDDMGVLGRIKLGTESNGGFRNILISDCVCENTRGILVGVVDGGVLEDVVVSNIILRNPVNHPLFVRQAARLRAPEGTTVGACRRVRFDNIQVSDADGRYPCGVQGIPDAPVMDVSFSNVHVVSSGGGTAEDAARTPKEKREASLEVSFMGTLPAYGFYGRNVRGLNIRDCTFDVETPDARPAIMLDDVKGGRIEGFGASQVVRRNSSDVFTSS
jgi:polygalacturonase